VRLAIQPKGAKPPHQKREAPRFRQAERNRFWAQQIKNDLLIFNSWMRSQS